MILRRTLAVFLLLVALAALAFSRAFPFLDDLSAAAKSGITVGAAVCVLAAVRVWLGKAPEQ
jgi:multisubunit Na+/H+ antiporter MnhG subunit